MISVGLYLLSCIYPSGSSCGTTCHCTSAPSVTPIHSSADSKLICSANFMTRPIPAILCRPSYFIVFYCIAFYCWTGQLRCKSSLSDIIIIIIITIVCLLWCCQRCFVHWPVAEPWFWQLSITTAVCSAWAQASHSLYETWPAHERRGGRHQREFVVTFPASECECEYWIYIAQYHEASLLR